MKIEGHMYGPPLVLFRLRRWLRERFRIEVEHHLDGGEDRFTLQLLAPVIVLVRRQFSKVELETVLKTLASLREKGVRSTVLKPEAFFETTIHGHVIWQDPMVLEDEEIDFVIEGLRTIFAEPPDATHRAGVYR